MKKLYITLVFSILGFSLSHSQTCSEILQYVKSEGGYGSNYFSPGSEAISEVTFYEITDESYNSYYFAVVQFTSSFQEYIYQVGSDTEFNYSLYYLNSAGKAFWEYIEPYADVLDCSPRF